MTSRTRSGTNFKETSETTATEDGSTEMAETSELACMLKALLDDRKVLEAELREERRVRAEETARRDEEMRAQMDLIRGLVEGARGEGGGDRRPYTRDPRVAKLTDADDIEAYLVTFERLMTAYEVPENRWAFKLAPQLSGRAQQAYAALSGDAASSYVEVKEAILRRYNVNEETYRQRFRTASVKTEETTRELRVRLEDLAKKWTKDCDTVEKLQDVIVLEQLINTIPADVRVWVQEHNPSTSEAAAQLADDYLQARKSNPLAEPEEKKVRPIAPIVCAKCNKKGHKAKDCRVNTDGNDIKTERTRRDLKDITCFTCNQKGHYSANCPSKTNLLCVERRSDFQGDSELSEREVSPNPAVFQEGRIEGRTVSDVCLDTGCTRTMVRQDLVPANKLIEGDSIAICCAHGDTVVYPLARVEVEVNGQTHEVEAAVSNTLPMSMLMGTDMPALPRLVANKLVDHSLVETALAVTTRARTKAQEELEASDRLNEKESGICPTSLEEVQLPEFDNDMFLTGREKVKYTRSEKRAQRREYRQKNGTAEEVIKKTGKVNYQIEMTGKRKTRKIFHVNMLRRYHTSNFVGFVQDTNVPEEGDEICVWETTNQLANEAMLGAELTDSQREDVQSLIAKYSNVWSVVPGRTDKIAHAIETGSCRLVRQPSYRIPQAYKAEVLSEVQKMRQAGVIEPSTSQWSFPIVPVRKKDGSLRICMDYRKRKKRCMAPSVSCRQSQWKC